MIEFRESVAVQRQGEERHGRRLAICLLFFLTTAFTHALEGESPSLTQDVWRAEQGPWVVALEFESRNNALAGVAHILRDGRNRTEAILTDVVFEAPEIRWRMTWGTIVMDFQGQTDLANGSIEGELTTGGGQGQPVRYERRAPESVDGLIARPSTAAHPSYSYHRPPETGDGWRTGSPEESGLEKARLEGLMNAIMAGEAGDIHSLLVAKNARLVAEEYFHGWSRDDLHRTLSCTKSVASLLVGIALDQGHLETLDAPVLAFLPALADRAASGWHGVRLEHLLTMTAGVDRPESDGVERTGTALFERLLAHPLSAAPGQTWRYANANVDLLAPVLQHATGQAADVFADDYLFRPLGIETVDWERGGGMPSMSAGLVLRPRDMAKIGALVAARGKWQNRQIVPEEWIARSTSVQVTPEGEYEEYGYLWWSAAAPGFDKKTRLLYAKGAGSQFILVEPASELVVTATGGNHANGKLMDIVELVLEHLLAPPRG